VKVYSRLIFSTLILTVKTHTYYLSIQDGLCSVFIKVRVTSSKSEPTIIEISPLLRFTHKLNSKLAVLLQAGADYHQLVPTSKTNALFRLFLSDSNNA